MKKPMGVVLAFLLAAAAAAAPPSIEIPAEVRPSNGYARLTPKTDAVSVTYVALDGAFPFPGEDLKDARRFVLPVGGLGEGRYRFVAVAAGKTGEQAQAEFVVVVGSPPPGPKPGPSPGPAPDAFSAAVKAAVAAEAPGDRRLVPKLAELYEFGAVQVKAKSGDGQAYLADTWGSLHAAMGARAADLGVAGKLKLVQAAVGAELDKSFRVEDTDPITPEQRTKGFSEFARVALVLREVVK